MDLPVKLLHPAATIPARGRPSDAGLDLSTPSPFTVRNGEVRVIDLGIAVAIPEGCVGLILGRSGLAALGLAVLGGVIDHGYVGPVKVVLSYQGPGARHFGVGERIAQLVIIPIAHATPVAAADLGTTDRGDQGFGSSGLGAIGEAKS